MAPCKDVIIALWQHGCVVASFVVLFWPSAFWNKFLRPLADWWWSSLSRFHVYEMSDMSPHVTLSGVVNTVDESIQITSMWLSACSAVVCMCVCALWRCPLSHYSVWFGWEPSISSKSKITKSDIQLCYANLCASFIYLFVWASPFIYLINNFGRELLWADCNILANNRP